MRKQIAWIVEVLGGALPRHAVVLAQHGRQAQRLQVMVEQNCGVSMGAAVSLMRRSCVRRRGQQAHVIGGLGGADLGQRKVRIVLHVEPWRPSLDAAQQQMLDRVEADGAEFKRVFDGLREFNE
jgi:hypothetical protein